LNKLQRKFIFLIFGILFVPGAVSAGVADSLFSTAGSYYQNQEYEQALENYLRLEQNDYQSAALYFNIGNCYFKQGKPGYAILYYLKAKRLSPNDADINANLAFAQQLMPTRLEGIKINPVTSFFDMLVGPFTLNNLAWIASILFILLGLFLSLVVFFQYRGLTVKIAITVILVLFISASGLTTYKYRRDYMTPRGVIVADEARIYSGPGEDNDLEFTGVFGLTFEIEKSTDDYYLVIFENKRKGWIKKESVAVI